MDATSAPGPSVDATSTQWIRLVRPAPSESAPTAASTECASPINPACDRALVADYSPPRLGRVFWVGSAAVAALLARQYSSCGTEDTVYEQAAGHSAAGTRSESSAYCTQALATVQCAAQSTRHGLLSARQIDRSLGDEIARGVTVAAARGIAPVPIVQGG